MQRHQRPEGPECPCAMNFAIKLLRKHSIEYFICKLFRLFRSVIQSSHPVCNTIMLFGVIICLLSVILLGMDGRFISPETYPQVSLFKNLTAPSKNRLHVVCVRVARSHQQTPLRTKPNVCEFFDRLYESIGCCLVFHADMLV